jgi:segregation and condensation protein A
MPLEPIAIVPEEPATDPLAGRAAGEAFELRLPVFEGPFALLLHLIESRQLDVLTVPLADVADAYVEHLAHHPVDPAHLADFVAVAARLILLKSRRLLPNQQPRDVAGEADEGADEDELRRRLVEYRILRDASVVLGSLDGRQPVFRREPRESDLPIVHAPSLPAARLAEALAILGAIPEPVQPPPEVVKREITIAEQIEVLRRALSATGRVVLQAILAGARSRTEATVTFLATLELVRRRQVRVEQTKLFGPILVERLDEAP